MAAQLFSDIHKSTNEVDGWVSLEVSPLLANNAPETIQEAVRLHAKAGCDNMFIKIPGTPFGMVAVEECIFQGVPINVTLLFSEKQYLKAASAYMHGIERRIEAGLDPNVASVASIFISRWDVAVNRLVPESLHNKLGIAIAQRSYRAYQGLQETPRWRRLANAGAKRQRVLWASTGSKDPALSDTFYVQELLSPDTINTMPEKTLLAFADHGLIGRTMSFDGDNSEQQIATFRSAGTDIEALAAQLQIDGTTAFVKSWRALLQLISQTSAGQMDESAESAVTRPTLHIKRTME
jgi:transaldolase